jgi:REP element-mobilizing transposase RayT
MPARLLPPVGIDQFTHLMSRTCSKTHFFEPDYNKKKFVDVMRRSEEFSGVQVLAYAVMPSHFHILLHTPETTEITDKELFRRIRILYGSSYYHCFRKKYNGYKRKGNASFKNWWLPVRKKYTNRMYSTPAFMKTLKQRYACWFNTKYQRDGVFWGQRYKSVLIENNPGALFSMSTYIELNPVRAELIADSKDYLYCSYGAAYAGNRRARMAVVDLVNQFNSSNCPPCKSLPRKEFNTKWIESRKWYREYIVEAGEEVTDEKGNIIRKGYTHEQVENEIHKRGRMSFVDSLHSRVRYMTYGVVYGTQEFCSDFMKLFPDKFSKRVRENGIKMRKVGFNGLYTGRDLQVNTILPPVEPRIREY